MRDKKSRLCNEASNGGGRAGPEGWSKTQDKKNGEQRRLVCDPKKQGCNEAGNTLISAISAVEK